MLNRFIFKINIVKGHIGGHKMNNIQSPKLKAIV